MIKNITLSADEVLIRKAREKAGQEHKSLNAVFRDLLSRYVGQENKAQEFKRLMKNLGHVSPGQKFTRDEMNER